MIINSLTEYAEIKLNKIYANDGYIFRYFSNTNFKNNVDKTIYFTTTGVIQLGSQNIALQIILMSVNFSDIANLKYYDSLIIKEDLDFSSDNTIFSLQRNAELILYKNEYLLYNNKDKFKNSITSIIANLFKKSKG